MKNILVIGVISLVLFSASAAMSVWLQASKQTAASTPDEKDGKKKDKDKDKDAGHGSEKDAKLDRGEKGHVDTAAHDKPPPLKPVETGPKDKEDRAELRRLQIEIISQDMRQQFAEFEKRTKQLSIELKALQAEAEANDSQMKEVKQQQDKVSQREKELEKKTGAGKKIDAAVYPGIVSQIENMEPEKLADLITNLADSGDLEQATRIVMNMKSTKASKVLTEMKDPSLPPQIIKKLAELSSRDKATAAK